MNSFSRWLQKIMWGRYGIDRLNRFLLIISFVLILINMLAHLHIIKWLTVVILILVYCRMFSRNHAARARENQKYLEFISRFDKNGGRRGYGGSYSSGTAYSGGYNCSRSLKKDKTHKILKCPSCGEKLRVPKGVGKINITCPHCNLKFIKKV